MLKAYKYRLYPTLSQRYLIDKHINACRFVYNIALEVKSGAYAAHRKNISCFDLIKQLGDLKLECPWLKEVDSQALQQSVINLDKGFKQFFNGHAEFPRFKKKNCPVQSFRNPHGDRVCVFGNKVSLPKFRDGIRFVQDRSFEGKIKQTTISRASTGKYFISVLVEDGKVLPSTQPLLENTSIGIDLGLSHYIITSDGVKVDNPKHFRNSIQRLRVLQRRASRKKKGSANRKKANLKVALIHERITNQRKDFLHKLSTQLIKNHDTLCMEDLNISGMVKNHKLAGAISDAGWATFVEMCKYKAVWNGKNVLQIPTFEPSTKICSCCGSANHNLTLKDREWICRCGVKHDRDINAAQNIKNYCIRNSGRVTPGEPVELPALVGAMNQEVKNHKIL